MSDVYEPPPIIFLQVGTETTWCEDQINPGDVTYIRASEFDTQDLRDLNASIERLGHALHRARLARSTRDKLAARMGRLASLQRTISDALEAGS